MSDGKLHQPPLPSQCGTPLLCVLFSNRRWQYPASIDEPAKANSNDGMKPYYFLSRSPLSVQIHHLLITNESETPLIYSSRSKVTNNGFRALLDCRSR